MNRTNRSIVTSWLNTFRQQIAIVVTKPSRSQVMTANVGPTKKEGEEVKSTCLEWVFVLPSSVRISLQSDKWQSLSNNATTTEIICDSRPIIIYEIVFASVYAAAVSAAFTCGTEANANDHVDRASAHARRRYTRCVYRVLVVMFGGIW